MWECTPDTSDCIVKVGTHNPASQLPTKSSDFLGFPIQNENWEPEVDERPQNPRDKSGPAVHVRPTITFPVAGNFLAATLVVLQVK